MILAGAFLGWTTFAAAVVDVQSTANCPSREAIVERLLPLLPERSAADDDPPDRARIEPVGDVDAPTGLRLRLERADGQRIGERQLATTASCSEAADAIAAIVAAWESTPAAPAAQEAPAPVAVAASPAVIALPPGPARRLGLAAGGGAGVAMVGGTAAVGTVELAAGLARGRWQLRLAAGTASLRQSELAGAHVDWRHTTFSAGVVMRTLHPRWPVSVDAGPTLGWATLAGSGFSPSRSDRSFEYGGTAGLRLTRWLGRFALWAEARTNVWVNVQQARATGGATATTADLPQLDASASLGVAVRLF